MLVCGSLSTKEQDSTSNTEENVAGIDGKLQNKTLNCPNFDGNVITQRKLQTKQKTQIQRRRNLKRELLQ